MRLQEQLVRKNLTSKKFAELVGSDAPTLSKITHYKCLPIPILLDKMCEVLECETLDIYDESEIYYKSNKKYKAKENNTYKLTVRLPKRAREFIKKALKKCGYRDVTEWIFKCYKRLEKQYSIIDAYQKQKEIKQNASNV